MVLLDATQRGFHMTNLLVRVGPGHCAAAEAAFVRSHPAYTTTSVIDTLRASEYSRFQGHTYLDYTGGGVYAAPR